MSAFLALALGYVVGQGSTFLAQAGLMAVGRAEQAGHAAILISLFSLSFQFTDLGNTTRYAPLVRARQWAQAQQFLSTRAWIGLLVVIVTSVSMFKSTTAVTLSWSLCAVAAITAFINGLSPVGLYEVNARYNRFAIIQAVNWLLFSSTLFLVLFLDSSGIGTTLFLLMWLLIASGMYWMTRRDARQMITQSADAQAAKSASWAVLVKGLSAGSLMAALPYFTSTLVGQVWGRTLIVFIERSEGLVSFAHFALVRQVQVASILLLGFIIRPRLNKALQANYFSQHRSVLYATVKLQIKPIGAALALSLGGTAFSLVNGLPAWASKWQQWSILFLPMLPSMLNMCLGPVHQALLPQRIFLIIEKLALVTSIVLFLVLYSLSLKWAVVVSESVIGVMVVSASYFFADKYRSLKPA